MIHCTNGFVIAWVDCTWGHHPHTPAKSSALKLYPCAKPSDFNEFLKLFSMDNSLAIGIFLEFHTLISFFCSSFRIFILKFCNRYGGHLSIISIAIMTLILFEKILSHIHIHTFTYLESIFVIYQCKSKWLFSSFTTPLYDL